MSQRSEWIWHPDYRRYYRQVYNPQSRQWDHIWQETTRDRSDSIVDPSTYTDVQTSAETVATPHVYTNSELSPLQQRTDGDHISHNRTGQLSSVDVPRYYPPSTSSSTTNSSYAYTQSTNYAPHSNPQYVQSPDFTTQAYAGQTQGSINHAPAQSHHQLLVSPSAFYGQSPTSAHLEPPHAPAYPQNHLNPDRQGLPLYGSYPSKSNFHYEELDSTYYVRDKRFFREGKVFSVLYSEAAGETAPTANYNDSFSYVKLGGRVHTQIRRFAVVKSRREFCYACPIFTYNGQGTTKHGVHPEEHAIVYSSSRDPVLVSAEHGVKATPICVVDAPSVPPLDGASRIYFGIHHPIQFNLRVKDLGDVHPNSMVYLKGYWAEVNGDITMQDIDTSTDQT